MIMKRPFIFAVVFGIAMSSLIGVAGRRLPYSEARDAITDVLALPGTLIAGVVYPEGVHTGSGAPNWGLVAVIANLAVYILFWYILLRVVRYFRQKKHRPDTVPAPRPTGSWRHKNSYTF